jgi:uncharacterized protein YkwD
LLAATVLFANIPAEEKKPAQPALHQVEQNLIDLTNAERARHGLRPLRLDAWLLKSARRHAGWMARTGNMVHTSAPVAENIAMGQQNSTEAIRSWMNSPGHRANMLSGSYSRIGAAAYSGSNGQIFWCLQFLD